MVERVHRIYLYDKSGPQVVKRRNPMTGEEWEELVEHWYIYDRTKNVAKRESSQYLVVRKRLDGKLVKE